MHPKGIKLFELFFYLKNSYVDDYTPVFVTSYSHCYVRAIILIKNPQSKF